MPRHRLIVVFQQCQVTVVLEAIVTGTYTKSKISSPTISTYSRLQSGIIHSCGPSCCCAAHDGEDGHHDDVDAPGYFYSRSGRKRRDRSS